jgi:hypothetical protein
MSSVENKQMVEALFSNGSDTSFYKRIGIGGLQEGTDNFMASVLNTASKDCENFLSLSR